jgi:hypothetical protein
MPESRIGTSLKKGVFWLRIVLLLGGVVLMLVGVVVELFLHYAMGLIVCEVVGMILLISGLILNNIGSRKEKKEEKKGRKEKKEKSKNVKVSLYQVVGIILLLCGGYYLFYFLLFEYIISRCSFNISTGLVECIQPGMGYKFFPIMVVLLVLGMIVLVGGRLLVGLVRTWRNLTDR